MFYIMIELIPDSSEVQTVVFTMLSNEISLLTSWYRILYHAVTCFRRSPVFADNIEMPLTFSV